MPFVSDTVSVYTFVKFRQTHYHLFIVCTWYLKFTYRVILVIHSFLAIPHQRTEPVLISLLIWREIERLMWRAFPPHLTSKMKQNALKCIFMSKQQVTHCLLNRLHACVFLTPEGKCKGLDAILPTTFETDPKLSDKILDSLNAMNRIVISPEKQRLGDYLPFPWMRRIRWCIVPMNQPSPFKLCRTWVMCWDLIITLSLAWHAQSRQGASETYQGPPSETYSNVDQDRLFIALFLYECVS